MIEGLTQAELQFIQNTLISPLKSKGARVFIFGSRAKGTFKKFSDIDLLYCLSDGVIIPGHYIYQLLSDLEESNFPYKVDLINEVELATSYKDNILLEMKEL